MIEPTMDPRGGWRVPDEHMPDAVALGGCAGMCLALLLAMAVALLVVVAWLLV